jgi:c-di-GMP-binding flagellar brake protein YcgR
MVEKSQSGTNRPNHWKGIRRFQRFRIDVRVKLSAGIGAERVTVFGRGTDVSEGGMAMYLPAEIAAGTPVEMELTFPYTAQAIKIGGKVRNADGFRYGVEFSELDSAARELVVRTCTALSLVQ